MANNEDKKNGQVSLGKNRANSPLNKKKKAGKEVNSPLKQGKNNIKNGASNSAAKKGENVGTSRQKKNKKSKMTEVAAVNNDQNVIVTQPYGEISLLEHSKVVPLSLANDQHRDSHQNLHLKASNHKNELSPNHLGVINEEVGNVLINKADVGGGTYNVGGVVDTKLKMQPRSLQSPQLRPDYSSLNDDMEQTVNTLKLGISTLEKSNQPRAAIENSSNYDLSPYPN